MEITFKKKKRKQRKVFTFEEAMNKTGVFEAQENPEMVFAFDGSDALLFANDGVPDYSFGAGSAKNWKFKKFVKSDVKITISN